jgi:hypothetical protein
VGRAVPKQLPVLGFCLLVGCLGPRAAARPPSIRQAPAAARPGGGALVSTPPRSTEAVRFVFLEPDGPAEPSPHVEVLFPVVGRPIPVAKAPTYRVRLLVEDFAVGVGGRSVEVTLDDEPPTKIVNPEESIRLGGLGRPGHPLKPGPHRLFAVAVLGDGELAKPGSRASRAPFAVVRFFLGARGAAGPEPPTLMLREPRAAGADGTVRVDYYVLGARIGAGAGSVEVTVHGGRETHSTRLYRWRPFDIVGLAPGEYRLGLQLLDPEGRPLAGPATYVERSFTVSP